MAKIYTRTGDAGTTGLFGGKRVSKSDLRIDAYGTIDELNSYLGLIAGLQAKAISPEFIYSIQSVLFDVGSHLAADPQKNLQIPEVTEDAIYDLEVEIDRMDDQLPSLTYFILPGGSLEAGHCHIARTICRRAERKMVALNEISTISPVLIKYVNRLSDYLFVLARKVIQDQDLKEIPWKPRK